MALGRVEFAFDEKPDWRDHEKTTSQMIVDITQFRMKYKKDVLPIEDKKKFCEEVFPKAMVVDYIYHLNVGELVGTQTRDDTEDVLRSFLTAKDGWMSLEKPTEHRESVNTFNALRELHKLSQQSMEGSESGMLTVEVVCKVHKTLMEGLHPDAGLSVDTVLHVI